VGWDSPLDTAATAGVLYQPQMIHGGDCGAIGGVKIGRGNRSTRRKPAAMLLCPPQIPLDQTRAAAVGSKRLTACAVARPMIYLTRIYLLHRLYSVEVLLLSLLLAALCFCMLCGCSKHRVAGAFVDVTACPPSLAVPSGLILCNNKSANLHFSVVVICICCI
jgi:hypothetical protein